MKIVAACEMQIRNWRESDRGSAMSFPRAAEPQPNHDPFPHAKGAKDATGFEKIVAEETFAVFA
jgi:hypothetical protein